jgi:ABC-type branched-subunit amino acid transport system ATPase component
VSASTVLEVAHVVRTFGGIRAVADVTFDVAGDSRVGVVGPNGAGKTVLLNLINGLYRLEAGTIHFNGRRIDELRPHRIAALGIGRTFQSMEQFKEFRVADYVMLGRLQHQVRSMVACVLNLGGVRRSERTERQVAVRTLDRLGLAHLARERMSQLPYGVQKQIDIARVIASEPTLMLLDEPTSGTTSSERQAIAAVLDDVARSSTTMIVVDHDVRFIASHCDHLIVMNYGELLAQGPPDEVLSLKEVINAYLGL